MSSLRLRPACAALAAALALAGCNEQKGLRTLAPGIDVSPVNLDFGAAPVGSQQQLLVDVTNVGNATLTVSGVAVADDPNAELSLADVLATDCRNVRRSGGMALEPNECARFAVRWAPGAARPAAGKVKVESNDPDHPVVLLNVGGAGKAAKLRVCPVQADGTLDEPNCTRLADSPPFLPLVDFGVVQPNQTFSRRLRLISEGEADLRVDDLSLANTSAREYLVGPTPKSVAAGKSADFEVAITPRSNGSFRGTLQVATNDSRQARFELPLLAVGLGWKLCVDPLDGLDFGSVPINAARTLTFTLKNCGSGDFTLKRLFFGPFAPTTSEFTLPGGSLPANGTAFPAGAEYKFDVTYKPTQVRADTASFDYTIEVPATSTTGVETIVDSKNVVGKGEPPVCTGTRPSAVIKTFKQGASAPFDPNTFQLDPLDRVVLDGASSTQPNGALTYGWRLVSQPAGGTEQITGTGARVNLWVKQAGDYQVELVVKDAACQSAPQLVTLHVVPKGALHVELTWPQAYGDVDVHLVGPGGALFQGLRGSCGGPGAPCGDVFFAQHQPDWGCKDYGCSQTGGVYGDGNRNNDATLDIDRLWGSGPENITYTAPYDGVFTVGVHYWCARKCDAISCSSPFGSATAVVRIWVNGALKLEAQKTLSEFQAWDVATATITGNGTQIAVAPLAAAPAVRAEGCIRH